jgi:hemerythrin
MQFVRWHEKFEIGIPRLDTQHRDLANLLNRLRTAVEAKEPFAELQALAAELTLLVRLHFSDEEMIMEGAQYPGLAQHQICHGEFTNGILELQKHLVFHQSGPFSQIINFELEWIATHIEEEDSKFGDWLRKTVTGKDLQAPCEQDKVSSIPTSAGP